MAATPRSTESAMNSEVTTPESQTVQEGWLRYLRRRVASWVAYENRDEMLKGMRWNIGLVAAIIAILTFQMVSNPPGGVRSLNGIACTPGDGTKCSREALLAVEQPDKYFHFLCWSTICFVASLGVCLLLASGMSLNRRFHISLVFIAMCGILISLARTCMTIVSMMTPNSVLSGVEDLQKKLINIWVGLLLPLGLHLTLRFFHWVLIKMRPPSLDHKMN